jgi:exonuclease III
VRIVKAMRIDHVLLTPDLSERLVACDYRTRSNAPLVADRS